MGLTRRFEAFQALQRLIESDGKAPTMNSIWLIL